MAKITLTYLDKASRFKLNRRATGMLSSDIISTSTQKFRLRRMENNLIFTKVSLLNNF